MEAFIDSSKVSLKAVLFHNLNNFPSIPLTRVDHMKENLKKLQVLLQKKKKSGRIYVLT
jgi:phenylacetate-coenzyme A ligase PaaK-like adenylate-forming protein